jgi:hypothetical protein
MIELSKFFTTKTGKYIISILLGFGLACLFRNVCKGKNCILFISPPLDEIKNKIYEFDNKCYTYKEKIIKCNNNKKQVSMPINEFA